MVKSILVLGKREAQIIKRMDVVGKLPVSKIAAITGRHKKTIYTVLAGKSAFAKRGPKEKLGEKDVAHIIKTLRSMIQKAKARYQITLAMLKKRAKCMVDDKAVRKALRKKKILFRRMRSKPLLTKEDRRARFAFAKKYKDKTRAWWLKEVHLHIDLKNFPVYTHADARDIAAMREIRGAYRAPGQGLDEAYVVLPKELRYNPGAKSCKIAAGIGGGKVRLWWEVEKQWTGKVAADMYKGPLLNALRHGWPKCGTWQVLEDNDPTGFKSKKGEEAKHDSNIKIFTIPKRSPDLNVCDYALWKQVTRVMRRQEKKFPRSKRESRAQHLKRLEKAAKSLSKSFVDNAIADMVRRCKRLDAAKGGYFEEGGRQLCVYKP